MSAAAVESNPTDIAETIASTLVTVAEVMAHRAPALNGDPQALDIIADGFDRVAAIGEAIERIAAKTAPGGIARRRFTVIPGGAT